MSFLPLVVAAIVLGILAAVFPFTALVMIGIMSVFFLVLVIDARPYWVLMFLVAFMPFENFILKFLPVPDQIYFASQFVSEFLIYLAFAILILQKMLRGASFNRTPIDAPLLAFVIVAFLSIVINHSPVMGSLMNLRSLLRYTILFYFVVNLDLKPRHVEWLLRIILFIGLIQLSIGALQLITNGALHEILMPKQVDTQMFGQTRGFVLVWRGRELGSIFGTLGDTLYFGLFMLILLAVYLGHLKRFNLGSVFFFSLIFMAIMYSYTRAVVFGMLLMLIIFYSLRYGMKKTFILSFLMMPAIIAGTVLAFNSFSKNEYIHPVKQQQSIVKNITGVFSRSYVEKAQKQRLGALIGITPTALANKPLLGYGPDEETTIARLNTSQPSFLLKTLAKKGFEDVYWVAILAYYGLAGVCIFICFFCRLFSSAWKIYRITKDELIRKIAVAVICIVGITPFLLLFYRIMEFRIYSFYFWLITALMFGLYARKTHMAPRSQ